MENNIIKFLKNKEINGLLITSRENNFYFSQFKSSFSFIFLTLEKKYFYTDSRYIEKAKREISDDFEIVLLNDKSYKDLLDNIKKMKIKKLGFEKDTISLKSFLSLESRFKDIELVGVSVDEFRNIKNENEIKVIQEAVNIAMNAWNDSIPNIKAGMTELEVEWVIINNLRKNGATKESFDIIVAAGKNSSSPHWSPTKYKIQNGDLVTIDFGAIYKGYCSDLTRTILIGEDNSKEAEQTNIYNIVLEANEKAIKHIKPGVTCDYIDSIARDHIRDAGYGDYFIHSLGHGLGIEVHEGPLFAPKATSVLEAGMIMTVEPGIYIPGSFGVRIEDDILVTKTGYLNLSKDLPKKLLKIK